MSKQTEFLKKEKILHLATIDEKNSPHIVPVWYMYSAKKIYVGTNTKTQKAKNQALRSAETSFPTSSEVGSAEVTAGAAPQGEPARVTLTKVELAWINSLLSNIFCSSSKYLKPISYKIFTVLLFKPLSFMGVSNFLFIL